MTDRSAFNEKPGRLDDQVGEVGDYAAEYRDNVQSISGSLKGGEVWNRSSWFSA